MPQRQKLTEFVIRRPEQVITLTGPVPQKIIAALERLRSCTVNELADVLGIEAESLYYHVRKFVRVGLLVEKGVRRTERREEMVYTLPGSEIVIDHRCTQPGFLKAMGTLLSSILRMADRHGTSALASPGTRRGGRRRNFMLQQHHVRLSHTDLAQLNDLLEAVATFVAEHDDPARSDWVSLTMLMTPVNGRS